MQKPLFAEVRLRVPQSNQLLKDMLRIVLIAACGVAAPAPPSQAQTGHFGCIEELMVPQYSALARNTGSKGKATVRLRFENASEHPIAEISGVSTDLKVAISAALATSTFASSCRGMTAVVNFEFILQEGGGTLATPKVSFIPPNTFRIRTAPGRLISAANAPSDCAATNRVGL